MMFLHQEVGNTSFLASFQYLFLHYKYFYLIF